jgi:hypothetical protein
MYFDRPSNCIIEDIGTKLTIKQGTKLTIKHQAMKRCNVD